MSSIVPYRSLAENEAIIERGLGTFVEVGIALMAIRDDEQYREAGFEDFTEYLNSKSWGFDRRHAYRMIDAAKVAEVVCPMGHTPVVERQARELAPLLRQATAEVARQVYAEVVQETDGKPTAKAIREKVQEVVAPLGGGQRRRRPDYNRRIDDKAIPLLREFNSLKLDADDWRTYSRTTLRAHRKVLQSTRDQLDAQLQHVETRLSTMPAK